MIEFSVIIPLYNKEKSIGSTIESVLNQSYPYFELIIINDGSNDNSLQIVQSIKDSRIKIISKPNGGVSSARNLGIKLAQNPYVVFLDADDLWLNFCLEEFQKLVIAFPDVEVFCTNYNMTCKNLRGSDKQYYVNDYYYTSAYYLAKWSIPIMITGCVTIKRDFLLQIGYFNEKITHGEDVDMWERLAQDGRIAKSEKITTIYRTESENRAMMIEEKLRISINPFQVERTKNKSLKLYNGVQSIFEFKALLTSGKYSVFLRKMMRNIDWTIIGLFFIIRVRGFNCHLSYYAENKCSTR